MADQYGTAGKVDYTLRGKELTADWLTSLFSTQSEGKKHRSQRVIACRDMRRMTRVTELNATWVARHPEAASWVVHVMPERRTIERDLKARVGAVKPQYVRTAMGDLDTDLALAERAERYMNEWKRQFVPIETLNGKAIEDGEYAVVLIPQPSDLDGCPDFFEHLDEDAYRALPDEAKDDYESDDKPKKRRKYYKKDDVGRVPDKKYDRDEKGRSRERYEDDAAKAKESGEDAGSYKRDSKKSEEAHDEAVAQWRRAFLADKSAATPRVIPALDCVPMWTRGQGAERWRLAGLVERASFYPEELPSRFGWRGAGDRAQIPQGFDASRTTGNEGQWYLYTAYFTYTDDDGVERPIVAYSVGGQPTCWADDPPKEKPEDAEQQVAVIDLYEEYGLTGPLWWYGGGSRTEDDDPDYTWEPYLWAFRALIEGLEGLVTSIQGATAVSAFTGHYFKPDAALLAADPLLANALVDTRGGGLLPPPQPASGDTETLLGDMFPARQATVSADAWRLKDSLIESLRENTSFERSEGGRSGNAMLVQDTIATRSQRHVREGVASCVAFLGEAYLRILAAVYRKWKVPWPISTTKERPVGAGITRDAADVDEFDLRWVEKDGQCNYLLGVEYPEEENLARIDLARSMYLDGSGSFEALCKAQGLSDVETEYAKILKDRIRRHPAYLDQQVAELARLRGDRRMLAILKLQNEGRQTEQGIPGTPLEAGMPAAAMRRAGEQATTPQNMAQQARAGAQSGQMNAARAQADAMTTLGEQVA